MCKLVHVVRVTCHAAVVPVYVQAAQAQPSWKGNSSQAKLPNLELVLSPKMSDGNLANLNAGAAAASSPSRLHQLLHG